MKKEIEEKPDLIEKFNREFLKQPHFKGMVVKRIESTSVFEGKLFVNMLVKVGYRRKSITLIFDERTAKFLLQRLSNSKKYGLVEKNGKK